MEGWKGVIGGVGGGGGEGVVGWVGLGGFWCVRGWQGFVVVVYWVGVFWVIGCSLGFFSAWNFLHRGSVGGVLIRYDTLLDTSIYIERSKMESS